MNRTSSRTVRISERLLPLLTCLAPPVLGNVQLEAPVWWNSSMPGNICSPSTLINETIMLQECLTFCAGGGQRGSLWRTHQEQNLVFLLSKEPNPSPFSFWYWTIYPHDIYWLEHCERSNLLIRAKSAWLVYLFIEWWRKYRLIVGHQTLGPISRDILLLFPCHRGLSIKSDFPIHLTNECLNSIIESCYD